MTKLEILFIGVVFVLLPYLTLTTSIFLFFKEIRQDILIFKERSFTSVEATIIKCAVVESSNGDDNTRRVRGKRKQTTPYHPLLRLRYSFEGVTFEGVLKGLLGRGAFTFREAYSIVEDYSPSQALEVKSYLTNKIGASDLDFFSSLRLSGSKKNTIKIRVDPTNPQITEFDIHHEMYWAAALVLLILSFPIFMLYVQANTFHYSPNKILLATYPIFLIIYFSVITWSMNSAIFADGSDENIKPKYSFTVDENFDPAKLTGIRIINND